MSFIPQITCRHCGTKFSALRPRCPSCGTRHVRQTNRVTPTASAAAPETGENQPKISAMQWQLIFGGILIVAVIVAVIILITSSLDPAESKQPEDTAPTPPMASFTPEPPPSPSPTPTPTPTVAVTSITIYASYDSSRPLTDITLRAGDVLQLAADVYPTEARANAVITWRSTDDSVCSVDSDGNLTRVGSGQCQILAESGGVAQSCIVRVP